MVAFKNTELQMTKWLELFLTTVRIDLHSFVCKHGAAPGRRGIVQPYARQRIHLSADGKLWIDYVIAYQEEGQVARLGFSFL